MKNKIIRILIFYSIAVSLSNIFRFDLFHLKKIIENLSVWAILLYCPLETIGVLIGALLSIHLLRKNRNTEISIFGSSLKWSFIMSFIPITLMALIGIENSKNINTHFYGFIVGIGIFIVSVKNLDGEDIWKKN